MKKISSLYIHYPLCRHLCNYCDFYKHKYVSDSQIDEFENLLERQFDQQTKLLAKHNTEIKELSTLYIGGGTPSLWGKRGAIYLKEFFARHKITFHQSYEFTLEIDPNAWNEEDIDYWLEAGVNRFSIGSQAFSEKYIQIMDRDHNLGDVEKTLKYFSDRKLNFTLDLMLGLPFSKGRSVLKELEHLLAYNPNHLSLYILKTRKNYPYNSELPEDDFIRNEYLSVANKLSEKGFLHYEVSNFAQKGFESKHNQKYWNYESVAAIGPNGTGLIVEPDQAYRYQWKSLSAEYQVENLKGDALIIEKLFMGIRHHGEFRLGDLFDKNKRDILKEIIELWKRQNYILEDQALDNPIRLTSLGFLMSDSMIDDIFKRVEF